MANKEMLIKAAEHFIWKCENGLARSKESYKQFKKALKTPEIKKKEVNCGRLK